MYFYSDLEAFNASPASIIAAKAALNQPIYADMEA
jgi:hypothetical protein